MALAETSWLAVPAGHQPRRRVNREILTAALDPQPTALGDALVVLAAEVAAWRRRFVRHAGGHGRRYGARGASALLHLIHLAIHQRIQGIPEVVETGDRLGRVVIKLEVAAGRPDLAPERLGIDGVVQHRLYVFEQ